MVNLFRSTLDVDTNDKEFIVRLISKIIVNCKIKNKHLIEWDMKESNLKGYHFVLLCNRKCDICRMCYDDPKRFNFDQNRPDYMQNVLFDGIDKDDRPNM